MQTRVSYSFISRNTQIDKLLIWKWYIDKIVTEWYIKPDHLFHFISMKSEIFYISFQIEYQKIAKKLQIVMITFF